MKNAPTPAQDNHANQLNPNNPAYWKSRGLPGVPADATPSATNPQQPKPAPPGADQK